MGAIGTILLVFITILCKYDVQLRTGIPCLEEGKSSCVVGL